MVNQKVTTTAFPNSQAALDNIANKYDITATGYGATDPSGGSGSIVLDIRRTWKDYKTSSSASNPIYFQRFLYSDIIVSSMSSLSSAAKSVTTSSSVFSDARSSLSTVSNFNTQVTDFKKNIYDFSDSGDAIVDLFQLAFSIYYGVVLGCVCAMIAGTIFFTFCGWIRCKCISHFGWVILTILMILGFLLSAILFPFSVVFIESCDIINMASLKVDRGIIPSSAWDEMSTCLVGDGDLYTKYDLGSKISFAKQATEGLSLASSLYDPIKNTLIYNVTDAFIISVCYRL